MKKSYFIIAITALCFSILFGSISPALGKMPNEIQKCLKSDIPRISPQKYIEIAKATKKSETYFYIQSVYKDIQPSKNLIKVKNGQCQALIKDGTYFTPLSKHLPFDDAVRFAIAKWSHAMRTPFGMEMVNSFAREGSDRLDNGERLEPLQLSQEDMVALKKLGVTISPKIRVMP